MHIGMRIADLLTLERRDEKLLPRHEFWMRWLRFILVAILLTLIWLAAGAVGFYFTAQLGWIDSTYNAAMILSQMGPVSQFTTVPAKLFVSIYALISGLIFISIIGIVLTPIVHRLIHHFHLEDSEN